MYRFPTSNIDGTNKRQRSLSSEMEHDRIAGERRESENRAHRAWGCVMDWFHDANREEAQTCLFELYSDAKTDLEKLDSFCRLRELAGEDHKTSFQRGDNRGVCFSFEIDLGAQRGTVPLNLSGETGDVLDSLFDSRQDLSYFEALEEAFGQTKEVSALIQEAHENRSTVIDLSAYPLVLSLPALPDSLEELEIPEGPLLTRLPDLPASLKHLTLSEFDLMENLPDLPPYLESLFLTECNAIVRLPALPTTLLMLYTNHCSSLESLPQLPSGGNFHTLSVVACESLRELPELPETLRELDITECSVALEDIRRPLGLQVYIGTDGRLLSPAVVSNPHEVWYSRAGRSDSDIDALKESWSTVENAFFYQSFESLLRRLMDDKVKSFVSASDVAEVIQEVISSSEVRELIFEEAQTADQDCHDRPLVIFNTVQSLARFNRLQRENAAPEELLALAEGMLKLALLDEVTGRVMTKQWADSRRTGNSDNNGPNVSEALEVQLELRRVLGDELALPFKVSSLYSSAIADLNEQDMQFAKKFVQDRMNNIDDKIAGLISLPMWKLYMKQQCQAELKVLGDNYGNLLEQLENDLGRLNSQAYDVKSRQLQAAREAEINEILSKRTKEWVSRLA